MSYNIDSVDEILLDARMDTQDIIDFCVNSKSELPESNFLESHFNIAQQTLSNKHKCSKCKTKNDADAAFCKACGREFEKVNSHALEVKLESFEWHGTGSGHAFDFLKNEVAPKVLGKVEAIFCWEGGFNFSGLLIKDGRVAEGEVIKSVKKPKGW